MTSDTEWITLAKRARSKPGTTFRFTLDEDDHLSWWDVKDKLPGLSVSEEGKRVFAVTDRSANPTAVAHRRQQEERFAALQAKTRESDAYQARREWEPLRNQRGWD